MKTTLILVGLALLLLVTGPLAAQNYIHIPNNQPTLGRADWVPFLGGDVRFLYMIKAKDLGANGTPMKITEIAVAPFVSDQKTFGRLQIRMSHTTLTQLSKAFGACHTAPVIVTDGQARWSAFQNTWSPLPIQWSFVYDGVQNLVIEIRYQNGNDHPLQIFVADVLFTRIYNYTSADPFNDPNATKGPEPIGPFTRLKWVSTDMLMTPSIAKIGAATTLQMKGCTPKHTYQLAAALSQAPLGLGVCGVNLTLDDVFIVSVKNFLPATFASYAGFLDATGAASGTFNCPNLPALAGFRVYHAAVTYNQQGISGCTNTAGMEIRP